MSPLLALAGCLTAEPSAPPTCTTCHGSGETSAPPRGLGGFHDIAYRGVGAHQDHLAPDFSRPVECSECHRVPEEIDDTGHLDTPWPAEVTWVDAQLRPELSEPFDQDSLTCTNYCHGLTLPGGVEPLVWTETDGACNRCHGFPPPPPGHPDSTACADCHPRDPDLHVDGVIQVTGP